MYHFYLDLKDEEERKRRLAERGEQEQQRLEDNILQWRTRAEESGLPFHFLDASRLADEIVKEALTYIAN